ncbi:MAG: ABC transporter ATP-binding protein [Nitrospina sp.]|nr:ABC transporter ATP-binding protein [Nitrospina sp.]
MESIGIASFYPLVDMLQDSDKLDHYKNEFSHWIPGLKSLNHEQFLLFSLLSFATLFTFKNIFIVLASRGNIKVLTELYCSWMNRIFEVYLSKPYSFFTENKSGDLVQRKIIQSQNASSALRGFIVALGGITNISGVFLVLCFVNLKAVLAITLIIVPVYYVTITVSRRRVYKAGDRIVELHKQGFGQTTEIISGIRQIKGFCAEKHFQNKIRDIWDEYSQLHIKNQYLATIPRPLMETLIVLFGVMAMIIFSSFNGPENELFPMLAVFAAGMYRILPLTAGTSSQILTFAAQLPSAETVARLLNEEVKKEKGLALSAMTDKIEFQNVSFSYNNRERVLNNLSLTFENNKFYGIVGVSGSGKSTIIDLIAGFFKPQKGKVLIDGIDLNDVDVATWLCQLGLISQDSFVFSGTIEDNICFGVNAEDRDQNRIKEAARIAYVDEFIDPLPEGYQTIVGERGVKLSGGQRQRLAIARAIYLNPPILIFDEATSSLDANSEKKVQEAIESLHGKRTVIVVAHRLVTIAGADYTYVVENGTLTEEGTHDKLRASSGLYSRLCAKQSLE